MYKIRCIRTIRGSIEKHPPLFEEIYQYREKLSDIKKNTSCLFGHKFRRVVIFGIDENADHMRKMSNYRRANGIKLSRRAKRKSVGLSNITTFIKR